MNIYASEAILVSQKMNIYASEAITIIICRSPQKLFMLASLSPT